MSWDRGDFPARRRCGVFHPLAVGDAVIPARGTHAGAPNLCASDGPAAPLPDDLHDAQAEHQEGLAGLRRAVVLRSSRLRQGSALLLQSPRRTWYPGIFLLRL